MIAPPFVLRYMVILVVEFLSDRTGEKYYCITLMPPSFYVAFIVLFWP